MPERLNTGDELDAQLRQTLGKIDEPRFVTDTQYGATDGWHKMPLTDMGGLKLQATNFPIIHKDGPIKIA